MWKNIVQPDRTHTTVWHMHIACWIPKAINTLRICNTCCFCTSTVVRRTRISVALYVHFLSCFLLNSELLGFEKLLFVRNIRISGSTSPTEKKTPYIYLIGFRPIKTTVMPYERLLLIPSSSPPSPSSCSSSSSSIPLIPLPLFFSSSSFLPLPHILLLSFLFSSSSSSSSSFLPLLPYSYSSSTSSSSSLPPSSSLPLLPPSSSSSFSSSSSSVCGSTCHLFSVLPAVTTSIVRSSLLIPVLRIWYFTVVAPRVHGAREELNICLLDNGRHYNCCNEVFGCLTATMGD